MKRLNMTLTLDVTNIEELKRLLHGIADGIGNKNLDQETKLNGCSAYGNLRIDSYKRPTRRQRAESNHLRMF